VDRSGGPNTSGAALRTAGQEIEMGQPGSKSVLVTGASRGVGHATALRLAAEGMNVPAPRYAVGKDARALTTMPRLLPDRLLDRIRLKMLGLPTAFGARDC
jgi:hypothetical protein